MKLDNKDKKQGGSFFLFVTGNIFIAALLGVAMVLSLFLIINIYTHHGESYVVPDLRNMTEEQVIATLDSTQMSYAIVDSIYDVKRPLGIVIEQVPKAGNTIKSTRPICLVINAKSVQRVVVPEVREFSLRQAEAILRANDLIVKDTIHRPGEYTNLVLDILLNGRSVKTGTKVEIGTALTLVVCDGSRDEANNTYVPNCVGLSLDEARTTLENVSLQVGNVVYDDESEGAGSGYYVYHQNPGPDAIAEGALVDLFLTKKPRRETELVAPEAEATAIGKRGKSSTESKESASEVEVVVAEEEPEEDEFF